MKLKHLESSLSCVPNKGQFDNPQIKYEQYPTPANLAASVLLNAYERGDVGPNRTICDLGCGTGILSIGCAILGSESVIGIDIDPNAIKQAYENINYMELNETIDLIQARVNYSRSSVVDSITGNNRHRGNSNRSSRNNKGNTSYHRNTNNKDRRGRQHRQPRQQRQQQQEKEQTVGQQLEQLDISDNNGDVDSIGNIENLQQQQQQSPLDSNENSAITLPATTPSSSSSSQHITIDDGIPLKSNVVDTVIINPPFGTKNNEGIDMQFLKVGCRLSRNCIYSFHKTSTRPFIVKKATQEWNMGIDVVAEMKFNIPSMYKFHKKSNVEVDVDLIRLYHLPNEDGVANEG